MCLIVMLTVAGVCQPTYAEKAPTSAAELLKTSTHVVTGAVKAVYQRTEKKGSWEYTNFVAEVRVDSVEKGEGISVDSLIYVRYWHKAWMGEGSPPPGTSGHYPLPTKNDVVRAYLARNSYDGFTFENKDGGFNVLGANGFAILPIKNAK